MNIDILTVVLLVILVVCAIGGFKAGLIKTVFSMFSFIIAIILSIWLSPMISDILQKNEKIVGDVNEKVEKALGLENKIIMENDQEPFIENLPLPASIKESLHFDEDMYDVLNVNSFGEYVTRKMTNMIINAAAFVGVFLLIIIILQVLCFALNLFGKLPVLSGINKIGGLVVGLLHGAIIIWVILIFITASGSASWGQAALESINKNAILSFLYDNNMLTKYITVLRAR